MRKMVRSLQEQSRMFKKFIMLAIKRKQSIKFDEKFYETLVKNFGGKTTGECIEKAETVGNCYFYALVLALSIPGCELKQGYLHRLDRNCNDTYYEEFEHSWVEKDGFVFDTTAHQVFNKKYYHELFEVEVKKSYTYEQLQNPQLLCSIACDAVKIRPHLTGQYVILARSNNVDDSISKQNLKKSFREEYVENLYKTIDLKEKEINEI